MAKQGKRAGERYNRRLTDDRQKKRTSDQPKDQTTYRTHRNGEKGTSLLLCQDRELFVAFTLIQLRLFEVHWAPLTSSSDIWSFRQHRQFLVSPERNGISYNKISRIYGLDSGYMVNFSGLWRPRGTPEDRPEGPRGPPGTSSPSGSSRRPPRPPS